MSESYDMIFGIFFGISSAYIFTFDIYVVPYTRAGWSVKVENTDGPGRCREGPRVGNQWPVHVSVVDE